MDRSDFFSPRALALRDHAFASLGAELERARAKGGEADGEADGEARALAAALEHLQAREDRFRLKSLAMEQAAEGIVLSDARLPDNPLIYVNPAFLRITGYDLEEVLYRNCRFLQGPETDHEALERIRAAIRDEAPVYVELLNHRKDGAPFWNALSIAPLRDDAGRVTHFVGIQLDITARREAQAALRRSRDELEDRVRERTHDLEQANERLREEMARRKEAQAALIHAERLATLGTLAAGVAHEFNNLHGGLIGILEILAEVEGLPEAALEWVDLAGKQARRAAGVTHNLLTFSRRRPTVRAAESLDVPVEDATKIVRKEFANDGVELVVDLGGTPPVAQDVGQIGQVVMNLLINARHAVLGRAHKRIEARTWADEAGVHLTVRDTGPGVPEEARAAIFEPFYTTKGENAAAGSPLARIRGTGLGLSVCRTIVEEHGGAITVDSDHGAGATFRVDLPYHAEAEGPGRASPPPPPALTGRILIIDGDEVMRRLLVRILERAGASVRAFPDVPAATPWLREGGPDLAVVDPLARDRAGGDPVSALLALGRSMHRAAPGASAGGAASGGAAYPTPSAATEATSLRIVLCSARPVASLEGGADLAAYPFIAKPFQANDLVRSLADLLSAGC